ncbi:acetoacetate decarboxylase family protein [Kribbella sp. NPDC050820]|uniref:acetoacetate decarboxylase family protein n=1 Tax=Kribbella sp. NPDC050820 TaxID=3155408 RepID=UPI0033F5BCA5
MSDSGPSSAKLSGYTLPLTPAGTGSLVPPPPWHFSGDVLWIEYRADPAAVAAFLPDELTPVESPKNAAIGFYDWQWCGDAGTELADPATAQFRECMIALDARLGPEPVCRVPLAWVDSTVPLVRGWLQGMPKIPGEVALTRSFPVGRATAQRSAGGRFHGVVSAGGRRLITASVELRGRSPAPVLATRPLIHTRFDPGWGPELPPRTEPVRSSVDGVQTGAAWSGSADLTFGGELGEFAALAPVSVGDGYVFSYAETLRPGRPVEVSSG